MADKPFGILLLGEGGSKEWKDATDAVGKEMTKKKVPFEFAAGDGDGRSIQKAVDKLQFQRVKKIVAVPLTLSSFSEEMEQDRYLLGVREKPSQEFSGAPHSHNRARGAQERVKAKVPVIVTKALDDSDAAVEILAARAKAQSHDPSKEILVLVGKAPGNKEGLKDWVSTVNALAEKVRASGGFRMAQAAALRDDVDRIARDRSEGEVRKAVAALHKQGIVIVVPLELTADLVHNRIPHVLEGIQVRYDGKTMLPDSRIVKWVAESAEEGAKLPEMRVFKEGGTGPALSQPSSQLDRSSQLGGGSQLNTGSQLKKGGN
jgi:sirohydrochlorin ferrochelatase